MNDPAWPLVVDFCRRRCGLVLHEEQQYLLSSRVGPVAEKLGYGSVLAFVREACQAGAPPRSVELLIDAMTTHETSFFRDPAFWTTFQAHALPRLRAAVRTRGLAQIWSAACSTGQEAHTLAMILDEEAPDIAPQVRIVGTDVSPPTLDQARAGVYSGLEVARGLDSRRLARHFEPHGSGHRVRQGLRDRIRWEVQNLLADAAPAPQFELVLCRNVLIYFDKADRDEVVRRLFAVLRPDGLLGVGTTELVSATMVAPGWYSR